MTREAMAAFVEEHRARLAARLTALSVEHGGLSAHDDDYNADHDVDDGEAYSALAHEVGDELGVPEAERQDLLLELLVGGL